MPQGYKYYVRKWLNKPGHHSTGAILATSKLFIPKDKEDRTWSEASVDSDLTLADCSRQITLDFYARMVVSQGKVTKESLDELQNTEHKAVLLRDEIIAYTEAVLAATQEIRDWAEQEVVRQRTIVKPSRKAK